MASLPLLPLAMVPALAWSSVPYEVQVVLALLVWAVLIGVVGFARTTRRGLIVVARRLLRVPLPDPVVARRPASSLGTEPAPVVTSGSDRWRTPLWLLLHVALGWTGALVSGLLIATSVALPLGADAGQPARLNLFGWSVQAEGGWGTWAAALVCLLLVPAVCAMVTSALRWLAPRLLGPSSAERLALAAERELVLAERNRLAHELHDSIGHTLTATTIQAAVAGEVLSADPVAARAAMRSIEESAGPRWRTWTMCWACCARRRRRQRRPGPWPTCLSSSTGCSARVR
ncbi:histidine kinase dimerization/phosphoacceptor domain-containing protein [Prescottella defluvii]|nr:histidine kinase dimerization/phosphoacceptor domain-containing protein [Prescottella defluvii]